MATMDSCPAHPTPKTLSATSTWSTESAWSSKLESPAEHPAVAGTELSAEIAPGAAGLTSPQDRGWAAYRVLLAVTIISAVPLGIVLSFGVFNAYYQNHHESADNAVWVGVMSIGITFLLAPPMIYICTTLCPRLPLIHFVWTGWLITVIALLAAAFSTTIPLLVVTQGLLLGLGVLICENPMLLILNTWFVERRGLAYGIYWGAGDAMAVGMSFLADYLLRSLGQKSTFLIFAAITLVIPGPCLLLLRERGSKSVLKRSVENYNLARRNSAPAASPTQPAANTQRSTTFYKHPLFYFLLTSSLLHALCFYTPQIYMSTYAIEVLVLPDYSSPLLLALTNAAAIIGQLLFGYLSDVLTLHGLIVASSATCAIVTVTLWGSAPLVASSIGQLALLCVFVIIFGVAGSGMMSLWARMGLCFRPAGSSSSNGSDATKDESQHVFGYLCAGRGLGTVVSGPLSKALLGGQQKTAFVAGMTTTSLAGRYGAGPGWRALVLFVGCMMAASATVGVGGWWADRREGRGRPAAPER